MKKNAFFVGPLLGYFFMATVPISFILFDGQRFSIGGVFLHELALIAIIIYAPWMIALRSIKINIIILDWIAIFYVFLGLIPVVSSFDDLYLSARDYRHLFLVPIIAYIFLQLVFRDLRQMT